MSVKRPTKRQLRLGEVYGLKPVRDYEPVHADPREGRRTAQRVRRERLWRLRHRLAEVAVRLGLLAVCVLWLVWLCSLFF